MIYCCIHMYNTYIYTIKHSHYQFCLQPKLVTHYILVLTLHQLTRHGVRMGVETVKSFNHYSERIQLSTESRKLPTNINDKDRQQQQRRTTKTEPRKHLLKRLPTLSRGIKSGAPVEAFNKAFDWLLNHVEDSLPTYRPGVYILTFISILVFIKNCNLLQIL